MARSTSYQPEYCEAVEETLALGYSLSVAAGEIGVTRQTLDNWSKSFPDFFDAIKRGRARGAKVWEERLAKLADSGTGNATAIIFALKNRLAEDWRDKTEQEVVIKDHEAALKDLL